MYDFRTFKSAYSVTIRYRRADYTETEYSCKMVIEAERNKKQYLFTLVERLDIKLNKEVPEQIMDYLMMHLGNSLYPLELHIAPDGRLISVANFEEIKEKWHERSEDLLRENRTEAFENYIEISKRNFLDESAFRRSLLKDSFIQLYFKPYGAKTLELDYFNFPEQSKKTSYFAKKTENTVPSYILYPSFLEKQTKQAGGELLYKCTPTGELFSIEANSYLLTTDGEVYKKAVEIKMDAEQRRVKTGFIF